MERYAYNEEPLNIFFIQHSPGQIKRLSAAVLQDVGVSLSRFYLYF